MSVKMQVLPLLGCASLVSCIGTYEQGPKFASAMAPQGYGVVYAYRERKSYLALIPAMIACGERRVGSIYSGGYTAFYLPVGKQRCTVREVPVEIEVTPRQPVFIRLEPTMGHMLNAAVVDAATGADQIEECQLAPGGRARVVKD